YDGDADALIEALVAEAWLDEHPVHRLVVHDWHDHCEDYLKKRVERAGLTFASAPQKAIRSGSPETGDQCPTMADIGSLPSLAKPSQSISPNETSSLRSEVCPVVQKDKRTGPDEPAILVFPCNGKIKEWKLTRNKVEEYQESFPGLDVMAECRKSLQWLRDNPTRRKTARGMPKFLNGWMQRANDRGPGRGRTKSSGIVDNDDPRWKED
ncbi:MAG TPA: hypothetical protein PLZ55_01855, partial [bacterium]|nr:hypothetical protein [bacterium]